jgi:hypothetical protein
MKDFKPSAAHTVPDSQIRKRASNRQTFLLAI